MDNAERNLRAHGKAIASVATAWDLARLHLVFGERNIAAKLTIRIVELLESSGLRPEDPAVGYRLIDQLNELGCGDAATTDSRIDGADGIGRYTTPGR
jgi:hypothetical protein